MPNAVLDRLLQERQQQIQFIDQTLERVEAEGRDLVDAETANLDAARQRIVALQAQIDPLEDFEKLRAAHADALPVGGRIPAVPLRADGGDQGHRYRSAGEFMVDLIRARGYHDRNAGPDPAAVARIQSRVIADQKTTDTTGILPTPIIGDVVNLIDANRPLISSLGGAKALSGIPGATFTRPKITQHTLVGEQTPAGGAGEKTQLPSQKMTIAGVSFAKHTYGGTVDISRQDIDWTSPSAWDILVRDLANVYAIQTETAVATNFKASATATPVVVATNDLKGWTLALYTAAMHSYQGGFMMPNRIWCSLDVWAALGSLVDVARVALPTNGNNDTAAGSSALNSFAGDMLGVPRIVVPTFAAGTCIVGPASLFEAYEEVIGLLSVVEPSILGVQVAYGGYVAFGSLAAPAFIPLTAPAGMPTFIDPQELGSDDDGEADDQADDKASSSSRAKK